MVVICCDFLLWAGMSLFVAVQRCLALPQGQLQISWQAQHFRKVRYRFRGRRSTFTQSSTVFAAGSER